MSPRSLLAVVAILGLSVTGCDYIVPPPEFGSPTPVIVNKGWAGIVNGVSQASGALHVDLSMVNNTGDWSALNVSASKAQVIDSSGKSAGCSKAYVGTSVFVNDGGWYVPAGFVMKGYTGGSVSAPVVQLLYVECAGVSTAAARTLKIDYTYISGPFNYYSASQKNSGTISLDLTKVVGDTKYPIAETVSSMVLNKPATAIVGINQCTVQLITATRTATGLEFGWETGNPTNSTCEVRIGNPPVIGADGILYGFYRSPHLADVPRTPPQSKSTWTTKVIVPSTVTGLYLLVPVETKQDKYFVDHVIDITDK
jgi:hypothetical protein